MKTSESPKSSKPEMLSVEVLCKIKDLLIAHKGKEVSREHWATVLGLAGEQKKKVLLYLSVSRALNLPIQ